MASCRIFRHVTKQALLQSLCRRPWWVTSCSIGCEPIIWKRQGLENRKQVTCLIRLPVSVSYPIGNLADAANLRLERSLHWLLRFPLQPFLGPFTGNVRLFWLVSEDREAELSAEVCVAVVACWNRDHVPGLKNFPVRKRSDETKIAHIIFL